MSRSRLPMTTVVGTSLPGPKEFEAVVTELAGEIRALDTIVASVTTYYESDTPALVSRDGHKTMLAVTFKGEQADAIEDAGPYLDLMTEETTPAPGFAPSFCESGVPE